MLDSLAAFVCAHLPLHALN